MRILALDPGSKLGWATNQTGRLEWSTEDFRIKNGESSGNRWRRFGRWLNEITGLLAPDAYTSDEMAARVDLPAIELIVYERSIFAPKARAAAEIAAGFTTRLEEHCERHGIALQPVGVQTLKAFAIPKVKRKKGDPKLDRSKDAMIAAAMKRLASGFSAAPGQIEEHHYAAIGMLTEHEADALWAFWWAEANCKEAS
jgi:hypothetical protein